MKRVYKTKEKRKLKSGNFYSFLVYKLIHLPDGNSYFILKDSFGDKHLLPSIYYLDYPIEMNQFYRCHVDKINCQGRIFLEPEHPYYRPGQNYPFKTIHPVYLKTKKEGESRYYKMLGETGENAYLKMKKGFDIIENHEYLCRISKIKKAMIFVELANKY